MIIYGKVPEGVTATWIGYARDFGLSGGNVYRAVKYSGLAAGYDVSFGMGDLYVEPVSTHEGTFISDSSTPPIVGSSDTDINIDYGYTKNKTPDNTENKTHDNKTNIGINIDYANTSSNSSSGSGLDSGSGSGLDSNGITSESNNNLIENLENLELFSAKNIICKRDIVLLILVIFTFLAAITK